MTIRLFTYLYRHLVLRNFEGMMSSKLDTVKRKAEDDSVIESDPQTKSNRKRMHSSIGDKYEETEYYFEGYLRKVYPYYYNYNAWCKGRWLGCKIYDVIKKEFRALPEKALLERFETGQTLVNGERVTADYILKNNDFISSKVHRHEIAVLACKIQVLHEDNDFVVVDKPPSMPVHACGRYRYNSVLAILYKDYGYADLRICHRLDRLTSGILMFAKTQAAANRMSRAITDRFVHKEYLARVEGDFPDGDIVCEQPVLPLSHKIGVCIVDKEGKECRTEFKRVSSFGDGTSLVQCFPKTGRMHQIRLHLQYLGYPIVNDPLYNSNSFGKDKGKNGNYGLTKEEV